MAALNEATFDAEKRYTAPKPSVFRILSTQANRYSQINHLANVWNFPDLEINSGERI